MKKIIFLSIPIIVIGVFAFIFFPNIEIENYEDKTLTYEEIRIAFIGDQGGSEFLSNDKKVLELIKNENVDLVIHQGDLGFEPASPDEWDKMITEKFGGDFLYLVSEGHHDQESWDEYQPYLKERIEKNSDIDCKGNLGVKSICNYKDINIVLIAPGEYTLDSDFDLYVEKELNRNESFWKICSMHNELTAMETERKSEKTGMEVFEACKNAGAIIATGHHHFYSRTGNIVEFISSKEQVTDPKWTELNKLKISKGSTFMFTSGLAGSPISYQLNDWPINYSSKQNATYGGLFCTFNAGGQPNKAFCYFKNIEKRIIDEFTITSDLREFSNNLNFINGDFSNSDFSNKDFSNEVLIDSNFRNVKFTNADLSNSILIGSILSGADLTGANLSGVSLAATDLTGAKLSGADLSDTNLSGMDLSGMDLSGTKLSGADLSDTNLSGMDLSGMDLTGAKLRGLDLSGMDLTDTNLSGADLSGTNLSGVSLSNTDLTGAKLVGADLTKADISGMDLSGMDLSGTELVGMDLSGMDLSGTELVGADLTDTNLSGSDLSQSQLDFINLKNTKMDNVNLSLTEMREIDFTKIQDKDLSNSKLDRASITYSDFENVNMNNVSINESNLNTSNFSGVDFTNTANEIIERVNFSDAEFSGANFSGMKFVKKNTEGLVVVYVSDPNEYNVFRQLENENNRMALINYTNEELTQLLWDSNLFGVLVTDKKIDNENILIYFIKVVQFQGANLKDADFSNSDLTYSLFYNADLTGANLAGADLTGANLAGADLTGANLAGADLTNTFLDGTVLKCINHEICE